MPGEPIFRFLKKKTFQMKIGKRNFWAALKADNESGGGFSPKNVLKSEAAAKVETPGCLPNQRPVFVEESTNDSQRENLATFGNGGIIISRPGF